jgi:phosphoglycerol transferase MdoB-like AlkP superfamily enzyme
MSMFMIGGGLSFAAISSGFAYLAQTLKNVSLLHVGLAVLIIVLLIALPMTISAFIKLRRRDIALLLEACGWSMNSTIRLTPSLARLFTHSPPRPKGAKYRHRFRDLTKSYMRKRTS